MAGTTLTEATKDNFRDLVATGVVLVDVWGTDCQPCMALLPHVEKLAVERDDIKVVALEAPKARRLCIELRVVGLPAFLLFHDGEPVARLGGPNVTPEALVDWLDGALADLTQKKE